MKRGLYTASTGMTTQMQRMDVISNNLANVNTTGYKRDDAAIRSFDDVLLERMNDPSDKSYFNNKVGEIGFGVTIDQVTTDFTTGSHLITESPLDFAIEGDGFFVVDVPQKDGTSEKFYTRNGSFNLSLDGYLVTSDNYQVQGQNGPINLSEYGTIPSVSSTGEIVVNGEVIDQLQFVAFEDNSTLRKINDDYYSTTDESVLANPTGKIRQGYVESSNVNSVQEMVELIAISRNYESNQKVIQTQDTIMSKVANDIGRK